MPDYTEDYPDMLDPAYILFEDHGSGEFAFGCVTGQIFGGGRHRRRGVPMVRQRRDGRDRRTGWAELQPDGSLKGQIRHDNGDDANFIARR